jgi:Helix-turn-helix domain
LTNQNWNTIKHKFTAKEHQAIKREARAELRRIGFDKLRQARHQTQVAVAGKLNIPQAAVSRMEKRSDVLLSTLRDYVGALGGRLELRAVFPDADFELETFSSPEIPIYTAKKAPTNRRAGVSPRPRTGGAVRLSAKPAQPKERLRA